MSEQTQRLELEDLKQNLHEVQELLRRQKLVEGLVDFRAIELQLAMEQPAELLGQVHGLEEQVLP